MKKKRPNKTPIGLSRYELWPYCRRAALQAAQRAKRVKVPYSIDAHSIDRLLVDQGWHCPISGLPFDKSAPFGPSLDRIVPELGYVPGNLRVVCHIVNVAMNEWGLDALKKLMVAMMRADDKLMLTIVNEVAKDLELP